MHSTRPRPRVAARVLAVATALAVALGVLTLTPGPAQARDLARASTNSQWLADQLENGTYPNPLNPDIVDFGLMIDAVYAMHASGDSALAQPILSHLDDQNHADEYYTSGAFLFDCDNPENPNPTEAESDTDTWFTGGATAKTLLAALVSGRNPRDFGGRDLVAATRAAVSTEPNTLGKVRDYTTHESCEDYVSDNANTFGQVLAVISFAALGQNDPTAIDALLTQQCTEGFFRIFYYYREDGSLNTCDEGKELGQSYEDGDSTGFALSALLAARAAGATGLDDEIDRTVGWLVENQDAGGGWGGGFGTEAPNTNSTGLIVQALAQAGAPADVIADGEAYLKSAQATAAQDSGNALAGDIGAIAYNPADYQDAKTSGIAGLDTWIRAGAQASLGLSQVGFYELATREKPLPAKRLAVSGRAGFQLAGRGYPVRATGLAAGETYTVAVAGRRVATGTASPAGVVSRTVVLPGNLRDGRFPVVVTGSVANRTGSATVRVLAAKKLAVKVSKKRVKPGTNVKVTVRGLAAGEQTRIKVGKRSVTGKANARGQVVRRVKVTGTGKRTAVATGAFGVRRGSAAFRAVR